MDNVLLLAVKAQAPCAFPIWKIAIPGDSTPRALMRGWARTVLRQETLDIPDGAYVCGSLDGPALEPRKPLAELKNLLPVSDGRLSAVIVWPPGHTIAQNSLSGPKNNAHSKLGRLRVSTRYCNVDRHAMGYHRSSSWTDKLQSGQYSGTSGLYTQRGYREAMQAKAQSLDREQKYHSRCLCVGEKSSSSKEFIRVELRGPRAAILNWAETCAALEAQQKRPVSGWAESWNLPFPVFVPSCGRAKQAHLNWEALHVFGPGTNCVRPPESGDVAWSDLSPVVCVVVEPHEEPVYRAAWPRALLLVLPERGRGPGYARWAIQRFCMGAVDVVSGIVYRLPRCWICDDNLTMFYRLKRIKEPSSSVAQKTGKAQRMLQREASEGKPMFREAMIALQRYSFASRSAVSGFLRDDGTASCKKVQWKPDEMALYKVVLLNLPVLKRLGVSYLPSLHKYEDIYLNHEVLKCSGHTLKCQSFCFRASQYRNGGCLQQRENCRGSEGTQLEDLVPKKAFAKLNLEKQQAVLELLNWVRSKESQCQKVKTVRQKDKVKPKASQTSKRKKKQIAGIVSVSSCDSDSFCLEVDSSFSESGLALDGNSDVEILETPDRNFGFERPHSDTTSSSTADCSKKMSRPAETTPLPIDSCYVDHSLKRQRLDSRAMCSAESDQAISNADDSRSVMEVIKTEIFDEKANSITASSEKTSTRSALNGSEKNSTADDELSLSMDCRRLQKMCIESDCDVTQQHTHAVRTGVQEPTQAIPGDVEDGDESEDIELVGIVGAGVLKWPCRSHRLPDTPAGMTE